MVKTAVIGASGFIGSALLRAYRSEFPDCLGTSCSRHVDGLTMFDMRAPDAQRLQLVETGHQAVIIAAAKPLIGYCEEHPEEAKAVNVDGTLELARQLSAMPLQVIFLSSDYVFAGDRGNYDDNSPTLPSTNYGRHKAGVERALPEIAPNHLILRLAKTYGLEMGDGTLLDEMAASLVAGKPLRAATDQFFCPTELGDLVRAVVSVQGRGLKGTLNLCAPEKACRYDLAVELARRLRVCDELVEPIALYDIPSMRNRPLDTSMICSRLKRETTASFLGLEKALDRVAENYTAPTG